MKSCMLRNIRFNQESSLSDYGLSIGHCIHIYNIRTRPVIRYKPISVYSVHCLSPSLITQIGGYDWVFLVCKNSVMKYKSHRIKRVITEKIPCPGLSSISGGHCIPNSTHDMRRKKKFSVWFCRHLISRPRNSTSKCEEDFWTLCDSMWKKSHYYYYYCHCGLHMAFSPLSSVVSIASGEFYSMIVITELDDI